MEASYNSRCPAVKRLFREAKELQEATEEYYAQPLEDNLFEWHFTVRGPPDTAFDGGLYHGRIIMPADYPMKPPNIIFLTPNGRFETHKKICLTISGHHPETWQPSWSIRTALLAIIGFMPTPANGTIGSLDYTAQERAVLAKKSQDYECGDCGCVSKLLKERTGDNKDIQKEAREVMGQVSVSAKVEEKEKKDISTSGTSLGENKEVPSNVTTSPGESNEVSTNAATSVGESSEVATNAAEGISDSLSSKDSEETMPEATNKTNLPGNTSSTDQENGSEILMEGITPRSSATTSTSPMSNLGNAGQSHSSGYLYNTVLSSAIILFIALVLRRVFLLESEVNEELDDVLL